MRKQNLDGIETLRPPASRIDGREDDHASAVPALLAGRTDVLDRCPLPSDAAGENACGYACAHSLTLALPSDPEV